jgi:hypothetical protein
MAEPEQSDPPHDLARIIEVLHRHGVDYLLAGGAAARAYRATRLTEDADCVVSRSRTQGSLELPPGIECPSAQRAHHLPSLGSLVDHLNGTAAVRAAAGDIKGYQGGSPAG